MLRTRRSPRLAPILAVALLVGCGGDSRESDAGDATTTTTAASAPEVTGREAAQLLNESIEQTRAIQSMRFSLSLAFDGGSLLGSQSAEIAGAVALDGTALDLSATIEGQADALRLLILGDRAWVGGEGEDVRDALPAGASWVELAASDLKASPTYSDPSDLDFLYLLNGATDIEAEGNGRYRFGIDLDRAIAESPVDRREQVAETMTFDGDAEPEITGEVTLDQQGRVREMSILGIQRPTVEEQETFDLEDGDELRIQLRFTADDIDEEVEVEAPDAADVVDIADAPEVATLLELEGAR